MYVVQNWLCSWPLEYADIAALMFHTVIHHYPTNSLSATNSSSRVVVLHRHCRIMLEKVADSARKAMKLAEPYKPYGGAIPRILLHFFIHIPNMHETYQKKYRILPIFLPALSAKAKWRITVWNMKWLQWSLHTLTRILLLWASLNLACFAVHPNPLRSVRSVTLSSSEET